MKIASVRNECYILCFFYLLKEKQGMGFDGSSVYVGV